MVGLLWYLIPISILGSIFAAILKSPWFKGVMGEFIINFSVVFLLDKKQYHLIKNVTLPTADGSTQIDHIIVSKFGVFVIETKNMKGWIFGSPTQKTWTQKIYRTSRKFQNPLHQNYKHIKTLESLLNLDGHQLHSVIVFVGDSTFKTKMPDNVTRGIGYAKYIKSKKIPVLTDSQVAEISQKIEQGRLTPSFKTNREHIKHVQKIVEEKQKGQALHCPQCGASMVLRQGKKGKNTGGKFWGCSRFPKCRGIRHYP